MSFVVIESILTVTGASDFLSLFPLTEQVIDSPGAFGSCHLPESDDTDNGKHESTFKMEIVFHPNWLLFSSAKYSQ